MLRRATGTQQLQDREPQRCFAHSQTEGTWDELIQTLEADLGVKFEKRDGNFEIHRKVSDKMRESLLGKNKYKKAHKVYQEYQKEKLKLMNALEGMKAKSNFAGIELDNGNVVTFKKVRTQTESSSVKAAEEVRLPEVSQRAPKEEAAGEGVIADSWEDIPDDWEDNSAW